ncbi:unnamed protein product [Adineta steineri]|uniref:Multifunctional fusion protein n=1 Tax=Adineta steineri TaxID=433720 RepID=A0A819BFG1_9BILA|nr:unnamed protein product [Adineta steineri]CAF3795891.1 unnamed protein product [Adineta steineri]
MDLKLSETNVKSSHVRRPRQRMTQNCLLLWVHTTTDQTNEDCENTLKQIRTIIGDVNVFTERNACIDFLTDAQEDIKSFLIVKDNMFQQIMPLINDIPQLGGVYILNDIKTLDEEWTKQYQKIKSVHTNIDDLCQGLQVDVKQCNQDSIAVSFVSVDDMISTDNLNQLEPTFMYTQIFKEIILDMEHNKQAIEDFIKYSRDNNCTSKTIIDRFQKDYHPLSAIWWYTYTSFTYCMLNDSLRSMDGNTIINMGFFIYDLHQQIQQLYQQQVNDYHGEKFLVYRGQGLIKSEFEKLQKAEGGLMSFNNFLSTSKDKEVSVQFAECASTKSDTIGILFIMSVDPCIKSVPFASIKKFSVNKDEDEILFSMHTVFRVGAIKPMDNDNQLYQVELELTSDDDQQLRLLTDRIREEAGSGTGWHRLGQLLIKITQFNKAEELYNVLLEQATDDRWKAIYYNQLGYVKDQKSDYENAIIHHEKALKIQKKILPSNHGDLAVPYNNIGLVYIKNRKYAEALTCFIEALEILQKTLSSDHPGLATTYSNIGSAFNHMKEYSEALSFYENTLEIQEKTLLSNHPDLATTYNNIACLYFNIEEYSKALPFFEKALEIRQKALPSNHLDFAQSYHNIGSMYGGIGKYSKALSFYENALKLFQHTLPPTHPDIKRVKKNIERVKEYIENS